MAISPHLRRLRELVGHELLVVPSVSVLPIAPDHRILLVQDLETRSWMTIGGAIEPDESPEHAAWREAMEEAGVDVELNRLVGVFGGPEYRMTYPNGDVTCYVTTAFTATVRHGAPVPDGEETSAAGWFSAAQVRALDMSDFTRSLLRAVARAGVPPPSPRPGDVGDPDPSGPPGTP